METLLPCAMAFTAALGAMLASRQLMELDKPVRNRNLSMTAGWQE